MPLRLSLKPNERVIIGGAVIKNGPKSSSFTIENQTVLLREKDVMTQEGANTPSKRIYLIIQMMYLSGGLDEAREYHDQFFTGLYEKRVIPFAGHNLLQEAPNEFAEAVLSLTK